MALCIFAGENNTEMRIAFASGNKHKLEEIRKVLPQNILLVSMRDLPFDGEIEEYGKTLEENAAIKARFIHEHFGVDCFADDTGLEVMALQGRPGVYSARYAGEACSFEDNVKKLLGEMEGVDDRSARFRTVICLIINGKENLFEGIVSGSITTAPHGSQGFGYDPVFVPEGHQQTFAEMDIDEKNEISHRARAVKALSAFLGSL